MTRAPYKRSLRCAECGYGKEDHGTAGECKGSSGRAGKYFSTLNLPDGKTCGDCIHIPKCKALFGHVEEDETCDFFPIRYREVQRG